MTPEAVAAMKAAFTPEQEKALVAWTKKYPYPNLGLIEALRSVQDWHRRITPAAAARTAEIFNLPFSHVWGVANFFPTFTQWKTGEKRVGICHGLTCYFAGSSKMEKCLEKTLGVPEKTATPDGKFSWETMECLGSCEHGPAMQVNDRFVGKATEDSIKKLQEMR